MGGGPESPSTSRKEFNVIVTGNGPFPTFNNGGHYPLESNTSYLVTLRLPKSIPSTSILNPTSLPINILTPTATPSTVIKTEYGYVRKYIPKLYSDPSYSFASKPNSNSLLQEHPSNASNGSEDENGSKSRKTKIDVIIHLGMADGWSFYSIEERAFSPLFSSDFFPGLLSSSLKSYYLLEDDAGKNVKDLTDEEGKGRWEGGDGRERMPLGLVTAIDVERAVKDVMGVINIPSPFAPSNSTSGDKKKGKMKVEVKSHFDAGPYVCGFIFYESLATCRARNLDTKVLFCHVPGWKDEDRVGRGAEVIEGIVGAVCGQILGEEKMRERVASSLTCFGGS